MPQSFAFIVYHTALSPEGIEAIGNIYPPKPGVRWKERWLGFQKDYLPHTDNYIKILFQSARLSHPHCRCIVLTDLNTVFHLPDNIEIHRYDLNPDKPAYNRHLARKEFLNQSDDSFHKVFLDYDMLIQQNLEQVIQWDFDVGLTDTEFNRITGSFIFVCKGSKEQGLSYFEQVERIFLRTYLPYEAWGGIEASMNDLFYLNFSGIRCLEVCEIDHLKMMVFPSNKYNYALNNKEMLQLDYLPEKMILHFKGIRKEGMMEYWNAYLRPRK